MAVGSGTARDVSEVADPLNVRVRRWTELHEDGLVLILRAIFAWPVETSEYMEGEFADGGYTESRAPADCNQ